MAYKLKLSDQAEKDLVQHAKTGNQQMKITNNVSRVNIGHLYQAYCIKIKYANTFPFINLYKNN